MHLSTWMIESTEEWSKRILYYWLKLNIQLRLWLHIYIDNTFNIYVTQDKSRIKLCTIALYLLIMCIFLSSHIFLLNEWQSSSKEHSFNITITSIMNAKKSWSLWSKIKISLYKISSMKNRVRMMHSKKTAQTCIKSLSIMRWIEVINLLLILLFQRFCLDDMQLLCNRWAIFSLREFCSFDIHSIVFSHELNLNQCHKSVWSINQSINQSSFSQLW